MLFFISILILFFSLSGCLGQDIISNHVMQSVATKLYDEVDKRIKKPSMVDGKTVDCKYFAAGETFELYGFNYLVVDNNSIKLESNLQRLINEDIRFCTTHVYDMSELFKNRYDFNANISDWDTREVIKLNSMFQGASAFNQNISHWDVSKAVNFEYMFAKATSFEGRIDSWSFRDELPIKSFYCMFEDSQYDQNTLSDHLLDSLDFNKDDFLNEVYCDNPS